MKKLIILTVVCALIMNCANVKDKSVQKDLSFENFLETFSKDSIFQVTRVHFPLECQSIDIDDKVEIVTIKESEWKHIDFLQDTSAYLNDTDKFKPLIEKSKSDTVNYTREGIDNGIHIEYTFIKEKGKWYLVKIFDRSS
jgi:hypothetical protein